MIQKIFAFLMSIIAFFLQIFGFAPKPKPQPGNTYQEYLNIEYGPDREKQILDLYIPDGAENVSLTLFIHGGAWTAGDKKTFTQTAATNARKGGIAAASMNYRFLTEDGSVTAAEMMDDITAALKKIKDFAAAKGVNIKGAALCGYSAGAHLALLYGYKYKDVSPVPLRFIVSQSGPTDLVSQEYLKPDNEIGKANIYLLFGGLTGQIYQLNDNNFTSPEVTAKLKSVSPLYYVDENTLPTIICQGAKDKTVPPENAYDLDKALTNAGVEHDFIIYKNSNHSLADDKDSAGELIRIYEEYVGKYF